MSDDLSPIVLLLGDEALMRQRAEEDWVKRVFGDASPSFNLASFSAADGAERAIEVAKTVPMMAKRRLVIIRDMDQAGVDLLEDLMVYAERPCVSTTLLLTGRKLPPATGGVDRGRRLEGRIKKTGEVRRFKAGERDPVRFAVAHAESLDCMMNHRAAQLLVELVGRDLGRVQTETDKVVAYAGGRGQVDVEDVEAVCSLVAEAIIWDLTDALVRRDSNTALAVAYRMLETGESPHRLLAMISWQIRQLVTLQDCVQSGRRPADAGIRMPRHKQDAALRALAQRPINASRLFGELADTNRLFNSSRAGDRRVFENLLLRLTAGR